MLWLLSTPVSVGASLIATKLIVLAPVGLTVTNWAPPLSPSLPPSFRVTVTLRFGSAPELVGFSLVLV